MNNKQYEREIAKLTSQIDYLEAELVYLNRILMEVGFPEGITTLKTSVEELIEETLEVAQLKKARGE